MDRCSQCPTLAYHFGLCRMHYRAARHSGTLPPWPPRVTNPAFAARVLTLVPPPVRPPRPPADPGWSVADVAAAFGVRPVIVLHWIWNGAINADHRGGRYRMGDRALHNFLWRYPAAWERAPLVDRAWIAALQHDPDVCAGEPADVRAARLAAERAGVAA